MCNTAHDSFTEMVQRDGHEGAGGRRAAETDEHTRGGLEGNELFGVDERERATPMATGCDFGVVELGDVLERRNGMRLIEVHCRGETGLSLMF